MQGKIRVLFVTTFPPPSAGVSNVMKAYFDSALAEWFELHLCNITRKNPDQSKFSMLTLANIRDGLSAIFRLIRDCIVIKPKIVNVVYTSRFAVLKASALAIISKLFGTIVIAHLHGGDFDDFYEKLSSWQKRLVRAGMHVPDYWIAPGEKWKQVLAGCGISLDQIAVIFNPIQLTVFEFSERMTNGVPFETLAMPLNVLFVGHISKRKGLYDILQVIQRVECEKLPVHFIFLGGKAHGGEMSSIVAEFKDVSSEYYSFMSPVYGEDYLKLLSTCDIFWLPSRNENLPIALLEAMTLGRPCITTRVGAIPEIFVDGENGFLVDPGQPEQLYIALKSMLASQSLRAHFSQNNLKMARERLYPDVAAYHLASVFMQGIVDRQ